MSEFTLKTGYGRDVTVKTGSFSVASAVDGIFVRVADSDLPATYVQARITEEQAVQIAHALLNVAEGKEADADRADDSAVKLLEQRMSALEGELQAEVAKRAASIATIATEITAKYSGVTITVKEPEQKFYLKLTEDKYINWDTDCSEGKIHISDNAQTDDYQTQFTQAEIDSNPELKKFDSFKIPVPAVELAESTGAFRVPVPDGMVISG